MANYAKVTVSQPAPIAEYVAPAAYQSQYADQISGMLDQVVNPQEFSYDPLQDANYQALAQIYNKRGEQAAKNTLGDAAALNGGYGSSYAVTASQQARNDYNQELISNIPALYEAAYNRYADAYNRKVSALNALQTQDNTEYGRYRDTVSDAQWKYQTDYNKWRDLTSDYQWGMGYNFDVDKATEADSQWLKQFNYQKQRDKVADKQWAKEYALDYYNAHKSSGSGGGGGGSSSGYSSGSSSANTANVYKAAGNTLSGMKSVAKGVGKVLKIYK